MIQIKVYHYQEDHCSNGESCTDLTSVQGDCERPPKRRRIGDDSSMILVTDSIVSTSSPGPSSSASLGT